MRNTRIHSTQHSRSPQPDDQIECDNTNAHPITSMHTETEIVDNIASIEGIIAIIDSDSNAFIPDESNSLSTIDFVDSSASGSSHKSLSKGNNFSKFHRELAAWAIKTKQTKSALNDLLTILRVKDETLPKDYRTLCKTPSNSNVQINEMDGGKYIHFGIENCLKHFIWTHKLEACIVEIDISIDGVPISKSSSKCLWPILINVPGYSTIMVVGVYFGNEKPADIDKFMQRFVEEYLFLSSNGLHMLGKRFELVIRCVVADAPARAFFSNIKSHSGYFSCHRCHIKGVYRGNSVRFPGTKNELRTNEEFRDKKDQKHHKSSNSLQFERIHNFDFVSDVIIDVMHSAFLGVMRSLLVCWVHERKNRFSLKKTEIEMLSARLRNIRLPEEFCRKPRDLKDLARFKATELRQLLLYILPICLVGVLRKEYYEHFLKFHCAIRILCSPDKCIELNRLASLFLKQFVEQFPRLYGVQRVSFNVHSLLHIAKDVEKFGQPLDNLSAFKFENYLQILKKRPKNGYRVLEQIYNRRAEEQMIDTYFPISENFRTPYHFSTKNYNNFIFIVDVGKIVKISKIEQETDTTLIAYGCEVLELSPCYESPICSSLIGMYKTNDTMKFDEIGKIELSVSNIKKVAQLPQEHKNYFVVLIHS